MKKHLLLYLFFSFSQLSVSSQTSFMTYNLRYDNAGDKDNSWPLRKEEMVSMIQFYHPDVLGIQEGLYHQVQYLDSSLVNYDYAGVGRDDGDKKGEFSAIFFNAQHFKLLKTKTYWLSDTPEKVSVGWDAAMERIVTFAMLKSLSSKDTLYVFNCHMDHIGKVARENSAKLILQIIDAMNINRNKVIVMGDFNSEPSEPAALFFAQKMDCGYDAKDVITYGPLGTFNAFDITSPVTKRIDYIFTKNIRVTNYIHIDDRRKNNLWLSDHLPVLVNCK
ncbi:MAG TPA: endonuclease/exonuclease/phosphatase family protein [Bacteroidia bacterium]|nr:endonuclease/exonuclease/phosphatase family protein [Bacteroidia bacterium]